MKVPPNPPGRDLADKIARRRKGEGIAGTPPPAGRRMLPNPFPKTRESDRMIPRSPTVSEYMYDESTRDKMRRAGK